MCMCVDVRGRGVRMCTSVHGRRGVHVCVCVYKCAGGRGARVHVCVCVCVCASVQEGGVHVYMCVHVCVCIGGVHECMCVCA